MKAVPRGSFPGGRRPPGEGGDRWVATTAQGPWLTCGAYHLDDRGRLDERARRLSHEELAVAEMLSAGGHQVRSLPESQRAGRRPDLEVCGTLVEVKSFLPIEQRGRAPSPQSVFNKLVDAAGQAGTVVLWGRGSGLTEATVRSGLARLAADSRAATPTAVRVVGDGFDLSWVRRPALSHRLAAGAPRPRPGGPGIGL